MKFKFSQKTGIWLLGIWLILAGLVAFGLSFPYAKEVAGGLAIAAGVMIVMDA
jgi:hypothetical protein